MTSGCVALHLGCYPRQSTNYLDFRCWHQTDMPTALRNVRFRGQSRKLLLALSFSGFDPGRVETFFIPQ
jgi:hypothetical protein